MPLPRTTYDPIARIWSGNSTRPMYNRDVSVATVLFYSLALRSKHIGQISDTDDSRLTNGELHRLAVRCALNLARVEHVGHGDVVALVVRNHRLVAPVVMGCFALAAPVNTLDPDFTAPEIAHMLGLTRPKVVFCDADNVSTVRAALAKIGAEATPLYTIDRRADDAKSTEDLITASADPAAELNFVPTDIGDGSKHAVVIVCSSGTAGASKAISISHALMLHKSSARNPMGDGDISFCFSSLYWLSGLFTLLRLYCPPLPLYFESRAKVNANICPAPWLQRYYGHFPRHFGGGQTFDYPLWVPLQGLSSDGVAAVCHHPGFARARTLNAMETSAQYQDVVGQHERMT